MSTLIKKYIPDTPNNIIGQDKQIKELQDYISNYNSQRYKALLLHGPTGSGKTSSILAIANQLNLEIVELNASDYRKPDQIELKVGNALKQQSLFSKGKLILIDDIDGLSGTKDRGGVKAILKLVETSIFPIIFTAINIFQDKLKPLAKKSKKIEFSMLDSNSIYQILKSICDKEKIDYDEEGIKSLSYISSGDARSAINDLESLSSNKITQESTKELGDRNRKDTMHNALNKIFKTTKISTSINSFENVDEDMDKQLLWLDENLPHEYKQPEDLANAYDSLSKADIFKRRIRRRQYFRFMVYINAFLTAGVSTSKKQKYPTPQNYKESKRILKMWIANMKQSKKKSIATKISEKSHSSQNQILKTLIPHIKLMSRDKEFKENLIQEFELDDSEVSWLTK
tara:strand:+ start:1249 stop:2448 length:1200 start_codon:yes stop_codon:yes gene_type:complete